MRDQFTPFMTFMGIEKGIKETLRRTYELIPLA